MGARDTRKNARRSCIGKDDRHLILFYTVTCAKKDRYDRETALQKLHDKLKGSKNPKNLISHYGYQKFLKITGKTHVEIDAEKILEEAKAELPNEEILS